MCGRAVGLVFCACLLFSARAQNQNPSPTVISGADHPELIPDNHAFMMLMLVLADGPNAMPLDARRYLFKDTELADSEVENVLQAANAFRSNYDAVNSSIRQVQAQNKGKPMTAAVKGQLDKLIAQGWSGVASARQTLEATLGSASTGKLWQLINTVIRPSMDLVSGN